MTASSVAIVIPCYNESKRFPVADYQRFLKEHPQVHLLFVNDGSTDKTLDVLSNLSAEFSSNTSVLNLEKNAGKAEAVRQGVLNIITTQHSDSKYIAYLDADLSTPLSEIVRFASLMDANEALSFVAGSRIKLYGSTRIKRYTYRHYFGRIIATMISESLSIAIYDTQCGAKIFNAQIAKTIFSDSFKSKWLFDVEIFFRLINLYSREKMEDHVMEIPVTSWEEKGQSKITFLDLLQVPFDLWRIKRTYRKS